MPVFVEESDHIRRPSFRQTKDYCETAYYTGGRQDSVQRFYIAQMT